MSSERNSNEAASINSRCMMKGLLPVILSLFLDVGIDVYAQEIYGDWIKTEVALSGDGELSNNQMIKYEYLRYTFERKNKLFISLVYDSKGSALFFDIESNVLYIKNGNGFLINSFLIEKITDDQLILKQKGKNGYEDSSCIKYNFMRERIYQDGIPVKPSDVLLVSGTDSVYKSSEKIYAKYSGDQSFLNFCLGYLPEVDERGYFLSTFIIRENGMIDNLEILENINKRFEKQFRKALNKSKTRWIPAEINGQKVDVQMKIEFKYFTSDQMIPMYDFLQKGKKAMNSSDYSGALTYFDLALEKVPDDYEVIYYKAICELNLGNIEAACESLQVVRNTGKMNIEELIKESCTSSGLEH